MEKDIVFILDRSGSMQALTDETIAGYNSILESNREGIGIFITTVLFDDKYEILHKEIPIKYVEKITRKEYNTRGMTALYDAIGRTILDSNSDRNKLVVIITDGLENNSKEYKREQIKRMIQTKEEFGWEFLFIGANIDSAEVGGSIGINASNTANYSHTTRGTQSVYRSLGTTVSNFVEKGTVPENWSEEIE